MVTEGVLTRMLQQDAALEGVGLVIFDEFHERSLQADLGLALALDAQANLAPELKLLVMSATLDAQGIAAKFGDAPLVQSAGRSWPVTTRYAATSAPLLPGAFAERDSVEALTTRIVRRALGEEHGDVLVFLPGARESAACSRSCCKARCPPTRGFCPCSGSWGLRNRMRRWRRRLRAPARSCWPPTSPRPVSPSRAFVSWWIRVWSGAPCLIRSRAWGGWRAREFRVPRPTSARDGRRRLEAGVCYRAWSEGAQRSLAPFATPEILQTDLAGLALELAAWGANDAATLSWLDPPPAATLGSARDLLTRLEALDEKGRVSAPGREMAQLPLHPRLAHMLIAGRRLGCAPLAAQLAALLSERDVLRSAAGADADIRSRLALLQGETEPAGVDRGGLQRIRRVARDLMGQSPSAGTAQAGMEGVLLAFAYPIASLAGAPMATIASCWPTVAAPNSPSHRDSRNGNSLSPLKRTTGIGTARITLAAPLSRGDLDEYFSSHLRTTNEVHWDDREQAVLARRGHPAVRAGDRGATAA